VSTDCCDEILNIIRDDLRKENTNYRTAVSPEEQSCDCFKVRNLQCLLQLLRSNIYQWAKSALGNELTCLEEMLWFRCEQL